MYASISVYIKQTDGFYMYELIRQIYNRWYIAFHTLVVKQLHSII